jgi:hypothetical protein
VQDLEEHFDSDKNLCLSLSSLISRPRAVAAHPKPTRLPLDDRGSDIKMSLSITDEFRVQASTILLERVTIEFLLLTSSVTAEHAQSRKISRRSLAETEYFIKNIIAAIA